MVEVDVDEVVEVDEDTAHLGTDRAAGPTRYCEVTPIY